MMVVMVPPVPGAGFRFSSLWFRVLVEGVWGVPRKVVMVVVVVMVMPGLKFSGSEIRILGFEFRE